MDRFYKDDSILPDDCFAQKAGMWLFILIATVVVVIVVTVYRYVVNPARLRQSNMDVSNGITLKTKNGLAGSNPSNSVVEVKLVAFNQPQNRPYWYVCPVCRYNRVGSWAPCPRCGYFPQQQVPSPQPVQVPAGQNPYLIKELALEAVPIKNFSGVLVRSVYAGSNAQKGGLKNGDIIVRFNGKRVNDLSGFKRMIALAAAESNANLVVLRGAQAVKATVMIGEGEMEGVTIPAAFTRRMCAQWR